MRSRDGIRVAMTTTGSVTPSYEDLRKPYRWNKNPDWTPNHPQYREDAVRPGGLPPMSAARLHRITEFNALLNKGLTVEQAGDQLGVVPRTAELYEREGRHLRGQQRGESRGD